MEGFAGGGRSIVLRSRFTGAVLCLFAALVIFPALGRSGLGDWDEAIYASVAREIFLTGDVLHLTLNAEPYYNKPPLYMALTAVCYGAFGVNEFSARFVSAVFGVLGVLLSYLLVERLFGKVEGVLTALFLLSSVRYLEIIRHGRMESMAAFFIALAVYALARLDEGPRWTYLFFVSSGLCVLTKGPMGLVPFAVAGAYLAVHPPARESLGRRHVAGGFAAFFAIVLSWLLPALIANGRAFFDRAVAYEIGTRIARAVEGHAGTPLFYLVDMSFAKPSAWGYFLPASAAYLLYRAWKVRSGPLLLMSAFFAVPFLILSVVVATKLPWYAFTLYLPAAFSAVLLVTEARGKAAWLRPVAIAAAVALAVSYNFARKDKQLAIRDLGFVAKSSLAERGVLIAYRMPPQALHFYTGRTVLVVPDREGLRGHEGALVAVSKRDLDGDLPGDLVYENAEYLLVRLGR